MRTLVAFSFLLAAVVAEPQYVYSGVSGVYPYAAGAYNYPYVHTPYVHTPYVAAAPAVVAKSVYSPVVPAVTYPAQDTSRGIPQPVQDTPDVKFAKAVFAKQYDDAVARNTGAVPVPVHTIHKRQAILPYAAAVVPVKTPASTVLSTPYVASSYVASPYVASPYVATPYVASAYSHSYPYVY